jgi:ABC-2 type transport system ATP-binding protein
VQDFIRQVHAEHDTTTLLCTHDMAEAEVLADRVGILDGGRLLALDTPAGLERRYGAQSLEEAFMAATGRVLEEAEDDDDDDEEAA